MNRSLLIISLCVAIAGIATVATVVLIRDQSAAAPEMQRATREKFFGTSKQLAPIERGQEMRPRW